MAARLTTLPTASSTPPDLDIDPGDLLIFHRAAGCSSPAAIADASFAIISSLCAISPLFAVRTALAQCSQDQIERKVMVDTRPRMRRTLSQYALTLACVLIVTIGVALTTTDDKLTTKQILGMIGLNLISSVVFALIFSVTSSRIQERVQADTLVEQHEILSGKLMQTVAKNNPDFIPIDRFSDTETFNRDFNRALTRSLEAATSMYCFRGTSAKYIPIRLRLASHLPEQVKIVMLDVKTEKAVRRGATDRQLYIRDKSVDQLAAELIDETLMSLVALYDCRYLCPIEIAFNAASGVTRVELFDDSVYVCVRRRGTGRERAPFPGYLRFGNDSFMYSYQRLELLRRMDIAEKAITFTTRRHDDELARY
jgi:hypothetical protein